MLETLDSSVGFSILALRQYLFSRCVESMDLEVCCKPESMDSGVESGILRIFALRNVFLR